MDAAGQVTPRKRPPGTWLVAIACLGLGLNIVALPGVIAMLAYWLVVPGAAGFEGSDVDLMFGLAYMALAVASVASVLAIALRPSPVTYRIVLVVAIAWVAHQLIGIALDISGPWVVAWQLGIVLLLIAGRAPFVRDVR
jgi:hypothetical protein